MDPCYESMSLLFTQIFVTNVTSADGYQSKPVERANLMRNKKIREEVYSNISET